jgi:Arc/MetJ-type ribon-helix-helix transcriptional regulator
MIENIIKSGGFKNLSQVIRAALFDFLKVKSEELNESV